MKSEKYLASVVASALLCGALTTISSGQQAPGNGIVAPTPMASAIPPAATSGVANETPPLTETALRNRYLGKLVFLRGAYLGDDLQFDENGKVIGSPPVASFTLSAFEVRKLKLSKHKLDMEADRYGLHFSGALPSGDEAKNFDKVKISKKPVHISIERELVVGPKAKKDKKKSRNDASTKGVSKPASSEANPSVATISPAQSAMLMNAALDNIFAGDIDLRMLSHLPGYWQEYFASKSQNRRSMPSDTSIKIVSEGMTPPRVVSSIDPSSNEYAQEYGIAGMELLRTVVDASGIPRQMVIARPIGFGLDEKAVDAIKNSRFQPATLNGQPVPVVIDLVVTFRIYSNRTRPGSVPIGSPTTALAASVAESDTPKSSGKDANLGR